MATTPTAFFHILFFLLSTLTNLWGQCTLTAPAFKPAIPGITWTNWATPPTGCPSATTGVVQITGTTSGSKQSLSANNTTYYVVNGSIEYADFNTGSGNKMNVVVCQGATLYLGVSTQNSTNVNIMVMPGGTLIPNTSTFALWKGRNYVYGNLISPNRDLSLTGNGGDSTVIYVAPAGIFQVTGTTTNPGPSHNSILSFPSSGGVAGIYNEGAVDVNDIVINSSSQPLICSNNANSCLHIRSSFPTTNTDDQFATGAAGGFLKYDATSGSTTYNKRVATTSLPATAATLKVCTSGANYCLAGGCCILTATCSTQVAGSPFGNIIPNSNCGSLPTSCSLPLSVRLAYFNADKSTEGVKIKWATSTQENSKLFVIEKSHDGIEWTQVGQLPASGTINDYQEYQLTDYSPRSGDSYYRLIEVETNNSEKIYAVDLVQIPLDGTTFLISPNPSNGNVTVSLGEHFERYDIEVIDIKGNRQGFYTFFPGQNSLHIPKPGMYLAKLKVKQSVVVQKFIVQ